MDGMTVAVYERNLEGNLRELHARLHAGQYRPLPCGATRKGRSWRRKTQRARMVRKLKERIPPPRTAEYRLDPTRSIWKAW